MDDDWTHVHVGHRTVTFGGTTYNFRSLLSVDVNVPVTFFGKEKEKPIIADDDFDDDNDFLDFAASEKEDKWTI